MIALALGGSTADTQWGWMVAEASGLLRLGSDPWAEYAITRVPGAFTVNAPAGPAVYAVRGDGQWQYVGKTTRSVSARLLEHGRKDFSQSKRLHWSSLVALRFNDDVSARDMSRLEALGRDYLRPRGGSAWG